LTPSPGAPDAAGAVAILEVEGDLGAAFAAVGIAPVEVGEVRVRDLAGVDRGIVARWNETVASLMPHGGPLIVRRLCEALEAAGIARGESRWVPAVAGEEPPAGVLREMVLDAIATAPSPLAIELLLDQVGHADGERRHAAPEVDRARVSDAELARLRRRLLNPPLVVALGPANIGKSALLNALAGRSVSIVADEPGTTRDHVGALLELGGLVVRYVDTPGVRAMAPGPSAEIEVEARSLAMELAKGADLVLLCGDAGATPLAPAPLGLLGAPALRVATRCDLGQPAWPADVRTSVVTGEGLAELAAKIREMLVPRAALEDPRAWRFWEADAP
jgi:hypothetical protein